MKNFFDESDRGPLLDRLEKLQPGALRQWGKMDVAQRCAHCAAALEVAAGEVPKQQRLLGVLLAPFVKKKLVATDAPMMKNAPTDPTFVVSEPQDFEKEKARLVALTRRFCDAGSSAAGGRVHSFFGKLTGEEWGVLMYKHLDHHLRQLGA